MERSWQLLATYFSLANTLQLHLIFSLVNVCVIIIFCYFCPLLFPHSQPRPYPLWFSFPWSLPLLLLRGLVSSVDHWSWGHRLHTWGLQSWESNELVGGPWEGCSGRRDFPSSTHRWCSAHYTRSHVLPSPCVSLSLIGWETRGDQMRAPHE